jgi:microcystin-dependent protein
MRKEIIVSVLSSLIAAFVFWVASGLYNLPAQIRIPSGAVMAFNATKCPDGWKIYARAEGSVIIGVGKIPGGGKELNLEEAAGKYQITLTTPQLPTHQHDTLVAADPSYSSTSWGNGPSRISIFGTQAAQHVTALSAPTGDGQPVDILPPYVALRYCEKQ